jgi:two-component system, sensor histidine kinase and response regulator
MSKRDDPTPPASLLIVDDHPANLLALRSVLAPIGAQVTCAASGAEALKAMLKQDFALIIMDSQIDGLDGYQTMRIIRERERSRDVPVIFLTAHYGEPEQMKRGYAVGAVDYITKPFDADILRAKVQALVALYRRGELAERARYAENERMRELFLGVLGHDLRNPLNAIMVATDFLRRHEALPEAHQRIAETADRAATRMLRMIEDILDLTRIKLGGGMPITFRPSDLGELSRAATEELGIAHPTRRLQIQVQGDVRGNWDADRLTQVVSNLVGNAIEHSTADPISVTVADAGARVTLEVHGQGEPIPTESLARLFEPFQRSDSNIGGLGLGLYIVREIARAHQGTVEVDSTARGGTSFIVTLPRDPGMSGVNRDQ